MFDGRFDKTAATPNLYMPEISPKLNEVTSRLTWNISPGPIFALIDTYAIESTPPTESRDGDSFRPLYRYCDAIVRHERSDEDIAFALFMMKQDAAIPCA